MRPFVTILIVNVLALGAVFRTNAAAPNHELSTDEDYFRYGSIGAEMMPLAVFQVLPSLFPQSFQPGGPAAGDWIDQFGFIRLDVDSNNKLPLGFAVSRHLPKSGRRSPISFVGFTCALCHSAEVRRFDSERGVIVPGMGNSSLDLVPFGDAIKSSVLDTNLTVPLISRTYETRFHKSLGLQERAVIGLWLKEARKQIRSEVPLRGSPFSGADLRSPTLFTSGPGRIMAPRETVRRLVGQTPIPDGGPSKLPDLYRQDRREWAQFDGSVRDVLTRNSLAALGVGATIENLRSPQMLATMRRSYEYVKTLSGPSFSSVFSGPEAIPDRARAARGKVTYDSHCSVCHGGPGMTAGEWAHGSRLGTVISVAEIGTDASRVTFRFYRELAGLIVGYFPDGHPLKPKRDDVRATSGYVATPLESAFSRAPFLHNGSVPTLAELINLKPRRTVYYRGENVWEPVDVGLSVTEAPDPKRYYRYDASWPGNSNRGHDYPWRYQGPEWDADALRDLLEYLKTI